MYHAAGRWRWWGAEGADFLPSMPDALLDVDGVAAKLGVSVLAAPTQVASDRG